MSIQFSHGGPSMSCGTFNDIRKDIAKLYGVPIALMQGWYKKMKPSELLDYEWPETMRTTKFEHLFTEDPRIIVKGLPLLWSGIDVSDTLRHLLTQVDEKGSIPIDLLPKTVEILDFYHGTLDKPAYFLFEGYVDKIISAARIAWIKNEELTWS